MMRLTPRPAALAGLALGALAPFAMAAPAHAADTPQLLGPVSANHVAVRLTHAETVQVYNDPSSVPALCQTIVNQVDATNLLFSPANALSCAIQLPMCVDKAVAAHAWTTTAVFAWDLSASQCQDDWS